MLSGDSKTWSQSPNLTLYIVLTCHDCSVTTTTRVPTYMNATNTVCFAIIVCFAMHLVSFAYMHMVTLAFIKYPACRML